MLARLSILNALLSRQTAWPKAHLNLARGLTSTFSRFDSLKRNQKSEIQEARPKRVDGETLRISKSMSWLLRHGAKSEGLHMRPDGYVSVKELLGHPRLRGVDILMLENVVKTDSKKRFTLMFEPHAQEVPGSSSEPNIWWIRANQGHTLSDVELDLEPITSHLQVKMAIHGTNPAAWDVISKQGISRMGRNHIHLAEGFPGAHVVSGIRSTSKILIFVNVKKALKAGIKFYRSSNGVILTPGNERGFLDPEFFQKVQQVSGKRFVNLPWRWFPESCRPPEKKVSARRPPRPWKKPRKGGALAQQKLEGVEV
ncbi:tRNA 2'-phosphotransferase 1 [Hypsizygus marmoreus]|uniref:2'-phosphotransferase n=1 Tax=Hypsizygus marmoreus TaxID=39966 RepID=A0A369J1U5_HYPMA|nr:tRNA 2'-phosphotransferase 1 [Hypsizygus marmoreus]